LRFWLAEALLDEAFRFRDGQTLAAKANGDLTYLAATYKVFVVAKLDAKDAARFVAG
jgi:uncharacterized protein YxjI